MEGRLFSNRKLIKLIIPLVIELGRTMLVTMHALVAIFLWPVSFVLPNALRAANDVRFTMWVGVGSMALFRVMLSWVLCVQLSWGALGVWIAMMVD